MTSDNELSNWNVALRLLLLGFYGVSVMTIFSHVMKDPEAVELLKLFTFILMYIVLGLPWAYFRILKTEMMINTHEEDSKYGWMVLGGAFTVVIAMIPLLMVTAVIGIFFGIDILHYITP